MLIKGCHEANGCSRLKQDPKRLPKQVPITEHTKHVVLIYELCASAPRPVLNEDQCKNRYLTGNKAVSGKALQPLALQQPLCTTTKYHVL